MSTFVSVLTPLRLILLFTLLYLLFVFTELQKLDDLAAGWQLDHQPLPSSPATQLPFSGINVELQQYDSAQRQAVLTKIKESGFGWVRQRLDWSQLEPIQGTFSWQESDALLQAIDASGLIPVIVLDGSPAWAPSTTLLSNLG